MVAWGKQRRALDTRLAEDHIWKAYRRWIIEKAYFAFSRGDSTLQAIWVCWSRPRVVITRWDVLLPFDT